MLTLLDRQNNDEQAKLMSLSPDAAFAAHNSTVRTFGVARWQWFWMPALVIVTSGIAMGFGLAFLRDQVLASGGRLTTSFANIVAEQATRTLQAVELQMMIAADEISEKLDKGSANEHGVREVLRVSLKSFPFVRAMFVLDTQGRIQFDSDQGNIGVDLSDRSYFKTIRDQPSVKFYISSPFLSRTNGKMTVAVVRPMPMPKGEFTGLVAATLELSHFDQLWRSIDLGKAGSVSLYRADGTLILNTRFDEFATDADFPSHSQLMVLRAKGVGQTLTTSGSGPVRTFAAKALPEQQGMLVVVGQSYETLAGPWRDLIKLALGVWLATSAAIVGGSLYARRLQRQREVASKKLEDVTSRLSLATEATNTGLWDWDIESGQFRANPTYFKMVGGDPNDGLVAHSPTLDMVHPDDLARVKREWATQLITDRLFQHEARVRHADGSYRWMTLRGVVLARNSQGRATRVSGVRLDTTETKMLQLAREDALERLQKIADMVPGVVFQYLQRVDGSICFPYASDAIRQIFRVTPEEVKLDAAKVRELLYPDDRAETLASIQESQKNLTPWIKEYRVIYKDGTVRWLRGHSMPQRQPDGSFLSHGFITDCTDSKLAAQALADIENRYKHLVTNLPVGVMVQNNQGDIVFSNAAAQSFLGLLSERISNWDELRRSRSVQHPDGTPFSRADYPGERVIATGQPVHHVVLGVLRPDLHNRIWLQVSADPQLRADGTVSQVTLTLVNITEQRLASKALATREEQLRLALNGADLAFWDWNCVTNNLIVNAR